MPERPQSTRKPQVTSRGAGHPDNGWAGAAKACSGVASEPAGPMSAAQAAMVALRGWFAGERLRLRAAAEVLEIAVMEQLRTARQQQGASPGTARLGLRLRAPRRPGGDFTIEWFLVQRPGRTHYIPRGSGDRYPRAAFAGVLSWERGIALEAEQRLGQIRRRLRLMKALERRMADFAVEAAQPVASEGPRQERNPSGGASS